MADAPWGLPPSVIYFRQLFTGTIFSSQILCFYLKPCKSNGASKLTVVKKSLQKFNVFGSIADTAGGYHPMPYIFRKIFSRATFVSLTVCLYLVPFRSYLASKLTVLEHAAYLAF